MKNSFELKNWVVSAEADAVKFYEKGNAAAGTRLRKAMQQLKVTATENRKPVID